MARCFSFPPPHLLQLKLPQKCNPPLRTQAPFADGGFAPASPLGPKDYWARRLWRSLHAPHLLSPTPAPRALSPSDAACPPCCLLLWEEPLPLLVLLCLCRESRQLNGDIRRKAVGASGSAHLQLPSAGCPATAFRLHSPPPPFLPFSFPQPPLTSSLPPSLSSKVALPRQLLLVGNSF